MKELQLTSDQTRLLEAYAIPQDELSGIKILEYKKAEFICIEGRPIYHLLLFLEGKAKVCFQAENGKSLLLCFYHAGGMIGELELIMNNNRAQTTVQAISAVKCIGIPFSHRRTLLTNIAFLNRIGAIIAHKLDRCTRNSAFIILYSLEARLCSYIEITNKDGFFQDKLTDIAELLGTSYRHLLRSLEKLCIRGILEKRDRGYFIVDYEALKRNGKGFYEPVEK